MCQNPFSNFISRIHFYMKQLWTIKVTVITSVTSATMTWLRDKKLHRRPSSRESTINQSKTKHSEQLLFSRTCHSDVHLRSENCHLKFYRLTDVQVTLPLYVLQIMHFTMHSEHFSTFPQMPQWGSVVLFAANTGSSDITSFCLADYIFNQTKIIMTFGSRLPSNDIRYHWSCASDRPPVERQRKDLLFGQVYQGSVIP